MKRTAEPTAPPSPKSRWWESNPQPTVYKTVALPLSYIGETLKNKAFYRAIGGCLRHVDTRFDTRYPIFSCQGGVRWRFRPRNAPPDAPANTQHLAADAGSDTR